MNQELQELKNLPLSSLISAPLNAAIEAQRAAALSTAAFVEQVGFMPPEKKSTIFSRKNASYEVRQAVVSYKQDEIFLDKRGDPNAVPPTKDEYTVVKGVQRTLQFPFIALFNVPTFEVSELSIDFNVALKSVSEFEVEIKDETQASTTGSGSLDLGLQSLGIPLGVSGSMKVEATRRSQFGLRYGEGHESEYNLHITVKAIQGPQPKGIERLLALADKIVDASEKANAEALRLSAPK